MTRKTYKVLFTRTAVGRSAERLAPFLTELVAASGANLPEIKLSGEIFQMRDLVRVGFVWKGTFAKLREDAPNVVDKAGKESELSLNDGDRVIEKCHFLLRERGNLLVWQVNRMAGGLTRAEEYLSALLDQVVVLAQVMDEDRLEEVLAGQLYQIEFAYDRPAAKLDGDKGSPRWEQDTFDMMAGIDAAHAKFQFRAPRYGHLTPSAKSMVRRLTGLVGAKKIRIRLTDESDPVELFMAPLKDSITVDLVGRYPIASKVFEEMEDAYGRQRKFIRQLADS